MHTPTFTVGARRLLSRERFLFFFFFRAESDGAKARKSESDKLLTNAKLRDLDITPVSSRRRAGRPAVLRDVASLASPLAILSVKSSCRAREISHPRREEASQTRALTSSCP